MRLQRAFCLLFLVLLTCRKASGETEQRNILPFNTIFHNLDGGGKISLTLKHERIHGEVADGHIDGSLSEWNWPFWDMKGETDFSGSWNLRMVLNEITAKQGKLTTVRIDSNNPEQGEAIYISLYTRDKIQPMRCRVGLREACGIGFSAAPLDLKGMINLMATDGEIVFTDLGTEKIDQRIRGSFWGTDKKHFKVKGDFDLKVVKVEKR